MSAPWYLRIDNNTAPTRLAYLRTKAAAKGTTWREQRSWTLENWESAHGTLDQGGNGDDLVYYTHVQTPYFRNERDCNDVWKYIDHKGWFSDGDCRDTVIGIVGGLSHGRLIAGYRWTMNDEKVWWPEIFSGDDAEKQAAQAADRHAEKYAEICRDDDEKYQAAAALDNKIEEALGELKDARPELWLALAARNCEKTSEKTRLTAQKQIASIRKSAHRLVKQIRKHRTERAEMGDF